MYPPVPLRPFFSSGPCVKPKEWTLTSLSSFLSGRSHRSMEGLSQVKEVILGLRSLLQIPESHLIALTPASATGAIEMVLWNLLGERPIDVLEWDIFSELWGYDLAQQLGLRTNPMKGSVPEVFSTHCADHDLVFTWSGTSSGFWVGAHDQWIRQPHEGLVVCDAASAVLTTYLPWHLLDATTFSFQKGFAGEASTGVLVLSPRALERLNTYTPPWGIPRLFRLKDRKNQLVRGIFQGETLQTPSMLCIEEYVYLLSIWEQRGGLEQAIIHTQYNFSLMQSWIEHESWIAFLVEEPAHRAHGPVCLRITHPSFEALSSTDQWGFLQKMQSVLAQHKAGFEVLNHAACPTPSLRIWCGPSVEPEDLRALFPWLSYAFHLVLE